MVRIQSRHDGVRIEFVPGLVPEVPCAPRDIRQVFLNLLSNAVEASSATGTVRVSTAVEADRVVSEICDEGRGLTDDEAARIFDPFYSTKSQGEEAIGLGLTIAWHIIEAHGGAIDVDSGPGSGTRFRVALPLSSHPSHGRR